MPSPFPGMDPYLEDPAIWPMVHGLLIAELCMSLNGRLPRHYVARLDLHVFAEPPDGFDRSVVGRPDIEVAGPFAGAGAGTAAVLAPWEVTVPDAAIESRRFIEIHDTRGREVVTAIELLSPGNNQTGADYLARRQEYVAGGVNVVEIDLLRGGRRLPFSPRPPRMDYGVLVLRPATLPRAGLWPFTVRDPMPDVPVPLAGDDPPVTQPLRPILDAIYDRARLGESARYDEPPVPPLAEPDATWASGIAAAYLAEGR